MKVFTIPPTLSFVDALAEGIMARHGTNPMDLAAVTVLLPNRRACRALREAFLRQTEGKPLLLPAIRPIGDVDEESVFFADIESTANLPPAISPLRRLLLLSRYIGSAYKDQFTKAQSLAMAQNLTRFLDSMETEGVSLDALDTLVPDQYAQHWQISLTFLKDVLRVFWPQQLAAEGTMDIGDRRRKLIEAYAEMLQKNGTDGPVIAAGSTGSIPATADLLKVVASLPQGCVVLPGLDTILEENHWIDALEEGHPQAGLARLLLHMGLSRAEVMPWLDAPQTPRETLISQLMRPAGAIASWSANPLPQGALDGLTLIEADTLDTEAASIALIMREHAEDTKAAGPCVLVTPDRILAARVALFLKRWGITLDDSGGTPLAQTALGRWLLLLCDVLSDELEPVSLLALLKHHFAAGGSNWPEQAGPFENFVWKLDKDILRGPRLEAGFGAMKLKAEKNADLLAGLTALETLFEGVMDKNHASKPTLKSLIELAENLSSTRDIHGSNRLWSGEAGEAAADFLAELLEHTDIAAIESWTDLRAILETGMKGISVRPRYGTHPYLAVLGPIEARLYKADKMILGSLNENTWPRLPEVDGWLSRDMRKKLELPTPERAITLSAHDFTQGLGSRTVFLTRSKSRDGAPTTPSRWIERLDTLLAAQPEKPDIRKEGAYWLELAESLDKPETVTPTERPAPNPPLESRPRKLSVTEIGKWRRDPYYIFAKHILGLTPLDAIAAEPDSAERGNMLHDILREFGKTYPAALPPDAVSVLRAIGEKHFAGAHAHPDIIGHWRPHFERMIKTLIAHENIWREGTIKIYPEIKGSLEIPIDKAGFTLEGRADRIEQRQDGWTIIDYKSGAAPSQADVKNGREPQLTLLTAILLAGGFKTDIPPQQISDLFYWKIGGSDEKLNVTAIEDAEKLSSEAYEGLQKLVSAYLIEGLPYTCWPDTSQKLRDDYEYAHLARIAEWANADDTSDFEEAA